MQIRANKGLNAKSSRLSVQAERGRSTLYFKYIESGIKIRQAGRDDGHVGCPAHDRPGRSCSHIVVLGMRSNGSFRVIGILTGSVWKSDLPDLVPSDIQNLELSITCELEQKIACFLIMKCFHYHPAR
jgi:hypothetical protein